MNAFEQPPVGNLGDEERVGWRPERCDRIALVLQGGGALGAYQAGVYEALHEAGIEPDWVSGVSIGAINAAIIAGNRREQRLERLRVILGAHHRPHGLALYAGWRHLSQGAQRREFTHDGDAGAARLFHAAQDQSLARARRSKRRDQLLRHRTAAQDAAGTGRFQLDLFSSRGALPRDIQGVMARQKDITYASRTRYNTDVYRLLRRWKSRTFAALSKVPQELLTDEERKMRDDLARLPLVTILHLIYQQQAYEGDAKDYEFSATSMREHWKSGYCDTKRTLMRRDYMQMPSGGRHVVIHDVHREREMSD